MLEEEKKLIFMSIQNLIFEDYIKWLRSYSMKPHDGVDRTILKVVLLMVTYIMQNIKTTS